MQEGNICSKEHSNYGGDRFRIEKNCVVGEDSGLGVARHARVVLVRWCGGMGTVIAPADHATKGERSAIS